MSVRFNDLVYSVRGRVASVQSGGRMPRQSVMAVGVSLPVSSDMGEAGSFRCDGVVWCCLAHEHVQRVLHVGHVACVDSMYRSARACPSLDAPA